MNDKNIEIQLIHTKSMEKDGDLDIRVLVNDEDMSILELSKEDILHIGTLLLSTSRKFINTYKIKKQLKLKNNDRTRKM